MLSMCKPGPTGARIHILWCFVSIICFCLVSAAIAAPPAIPVKIRETKTGTKFGTLGERPEKHQPTLFIFSTDVPSLTPDSIYTETGREVAASGWLSVVIDPPCHGFDQVPNEPTGLTGWAHRIKHDEPLMEKFTRRCQDVLDFLIAEGETDPNRVAAIGTSRGGFCAFHFAAAEARVHAVMAVSPVVHLPVLQEFSDLQSDPRATDLSLVRLADKLADRAVLLTIGNDDARVGTDECVAFAQELVRSGKRLFPDRKVTPVEIRVGPSDGHHAIDDAYGISARWLLSIPFADN